MNPEVSNLNCVQVIVYYFYAYINLIVYLLKKLYCQTRVREIAIHKDD